MKQAWQQWVEDARISGSQQNFGNLAEDTVYNMTISKVTDKGDSILISAKTTSGEGKGSFVSGFYAVKPKEDASEKAKQYLYIFMDKLMVATGFDMLDNIDKTFDEQVELFTKDLVGKTFSAKVQSSGEYWNIDKFSVDKEQTILSTDSTKKDIAPDTTEFGF